MGNFSQSLKRFISNKNTVTIIAVIAGVLVLWWGYTYRLNQAVQTISIPCAVNAIDTGHVITEDNIEYKEITRTIAEEVGFITDASQLIGKYVRTGYSIPAGGFFYNTQVCEEAELPNSVFDQVEDGKTIYTLSVDSKLTYGNSIYPGDYIDLYVKGMDEQGLAVFGRLIESIQVLKVTDADGKDVFWDHEHGDTAYLLFKVDDEYHHLLQVAELIGIQLIPIIKNTNYTKEAGETEISSQTLLSYINSKASMLGMDGV